ncbi:hypothetical protein [Parabacteroides sp.]|uniref:hypothetical protein n=1 Tax=Parabacteroides sp. TaxID=1869337 RepID=UPI003080F784
MNIEFNTKGDPLVFDMSGPRGRAFGNTTGVPTVTRKEVVTTEKADIEKMNVGNFKLISWGDGNDFPQVADGIITQTGVLNTGLKFLRNLTIGQGVFPCTVEGIDDNGNEVLKSIDNPGVREFLSGRMVRRYMEKTLRDHLKFGVGFAQMIPSVTGNSFAGINPLNALYCRVTEMKGTEQYCVVSGKFPDTPTEFDKFRLLSEYDPEWDLSLLSNEGKIKNQSFVYAIRDSWSNNDHYSCPVWWSAKLAGWIDIAHSVPKFLLKAYENQVTLKWHIQIPYAFWEKKFPYAEYPEGSDIRKQEIQKYMQSVEDNMCGRENAEKPLITMYAVNEGNGRIEEEWKITALDNKSKDAEKLVTSAAANSEILFSLMINPNVLGAGMPGGAYAGNQGGSNIREAFLVNIANAWIDRQNILDPLECFLRFNGVKNVSLRYRNTILTTLDTGAGTKKVLS